MKKRLLSLIFALILSLSFVLMTYPVAAVPTEYWAIQADYTKALESGDDNAFISVAERLTALFQNPADVNEYNMLAWPLQKAAAAYEKRGQFTKAAEVYSKFLECVEYLDKNGSDYYDMIKVTKALIEHDTLSPAVYTATDDTVVYHGAKNEPVRGTYFGSCAYDDIYSSYLLYANFPNESFSSFEYLLNGAENAQIFELAWNLGNEKFSTLSEIASGRYDDYITENLMFISTIDKPVLLRLFAEANCWGDMPGGKDQGDIRKADAEIFVSAFRHVATLARMFAPNAALVFSPNDISNWYVSFEDFYPGDEYVDWVGMSSYMNRNPGASEYGSGSDAAYARGYYDSQITKIKPIIDLFGGKKPIMISECGFLFTGENQNEAYASQKLNEFYSYVNMVYPEVKAVFYFQSGEYVFGNNRTMQNAYSTATRKNLPMQSTLGGETLSYCKLDDYKGSTDKLHLYTYADCPTGFERKVTYTVNGKTVSSENTAPFACDIAPGMLNSGKNSLVVKITLGADKYEYKYTLGLRDGKISVSEYSEIEQPSSWATEEVNAAISLGIVPTELQGNYTKGISRVDLAKLLISLFAKKSGMSEGQFLSEHSGSGSFTDTNNSFVSTVAELDIVNGYKNADGSFSFKPGNTLKRSEMAAVVNRAAKYFGVDTSMFDSEVNFTDTVTHWCRSELGWPVHAGIVKGTSDTEFSPEKTLTTEQTILMLYRLYNAIQ